MLFLTPQTPLPSWFDWIQQQHPKTMELGLDRIRLVADSLQLTPFDCPVITVAGTNGKGSCIATMQSILSAQGLQVGVYTSPHLLRFNERIRINHTMIDDETLRQHFFQVRQALFAIQKQQALSLTFFEFTTLAALSFFQQAKLDVLLLEIGLGGRLDAVNIVDSDIAVVSNVDFDHMDWLGETREKIAAEKAGILRASKPVVCGDLDVPQALLDRAEILQAPLWRVGRNFSYAQRDGKWFWDCGEWCYDTLPKPSLLLCNAATALMALHLLPKALRPNEQAIRQGLKQVQLSGRQQWISQKPACLVDVAHNPQATSALAQYLKDFKKNSGRTIAVLGMLADKAIDTSLQPLLPIIDEWHVASLEEHDRGALASTLAKHLKSLGVSKVVQYDQVQQAYQHVCQSAQSCDRIVIFGSFFTVAAVL